jgi:hypothetical protein
MYGETDMRLTTQSKRIADAVVLALVLISITSFILSYHTLVVMAIDHGFPIWLSWLWPLSLDLFMITSCLVVIRFQMLKQSTLYPWAVVLLTTFASIGFNVASVYPTGDVLTMCMYAVPPFTVFIALELLIQLIKVEQAAIKKPRRRPSRAKPKVIPQEMN